MSSVSAYLNRTFTLGQSLAWFGLTLVLGLLGAHFYRASEYGIALCVAGMLVFVCSRSAWKQYAVALFLIWGMVEWADSAYVLARMRMQAGMPWMRGAGILLLVALVTGLAGKYAFGRAARLATAGEEGKGMAPEALSNAGPNAGQDAGPASGPDSGQDALPDAQPAKAARMLLPLFQAGVFMATFLALFYLRQNARLEFLLLERYVPLLGSVQIFFASWYAAFVAGRLVDRKKSRKTRRLVWLVFACVFFAQFFLGLLGLQGMLLTGKLHVPIPAFIIFAPVFRDSLSMMPVIALAATLLAGSAWCSLLCYFGPFDSLASGKKGVKPLPPFIRKLQTYGRPLVLALGVLAALLLRQAGIADVTAVSISVAFGLFSLIIMASLSRRYGAMVHCTSFCPMGLAVNLVGRLSPWRVKVDTGRCDNCAACEKVCKYSAISAASRARGKTLMRCSLCRDCLTVCKQRALYMYFPGLSRQSAWTLFAGLASVLHVLFLSVAMV